MAFVYTTNVLLPALEDKLGHVLIALKNALVASGRWRVRGSGDGKAAFQLDGQTAGPSFDVFTASPAWSQDATAYNAVRNNSITQPRAWLLLEEIASGRVLLIQRSSATSNSDAGACAAIAVATGVATTGASALAPPALTGNVGFLAGTLWNGSSGSFAELATGNQGDFGINSTQQFWLQIAVENTSRAGNVAPWFFSVWNRTTNAPCTGGLWESLTDVDVGVTHPLACAFGSWPRVWGTVGNGTTGALSSGGWRGGDTLAACTLGYSQNAGIGATPPFYQQPGNDGRFRTERPWLLVPSIGSRHIGRLEHAFMNKVAREYPTTYDLAGAAPRLTLGHLIMPWTAVAPESSP